MLRLVSLVVLALVTSTIAWWISRPSLISIGPITLETRLRGQGAPTVVFEAGLAGGLSTFRALQGQVSEKAQTLTYARAGHGRSSADPQPPTAGRIAGELRALLGAAGVRPPVILVCYSTGCLYARVFAHDFPAETAGMVLVDPMTEAFAERMSKTGAAGDGASKHLSAGALRERSALPAMLAEARSAWPLPSVPYVVVTAMQPTGQRPFASRADMNAWLADNDALVGRLPGAVHVILPRATHASLLKSDELSKAVLKMVAQVSGTHP